MLRDLIQEGRLLLESKFPATTRVSYRDEVEHRTGEFNLLVVTTAKKLFDALGWHGPFSGLSAGNYQGTDIPLRKVSPGTRVAIYANKRRTGGVVKDLESGWVADRFGGLGARDLKNIANKLLPREA